ncbi:hypothetical protein EDD11_001146 [Mortierella claussenii]|nr:hypothetical protein EDD11_001146 [Mortierella claussenii]
MHGIPRQYRGSSTQQAVARHIRLHQHITQSQALRTVSTSTSVVQDATKLDSGGTASTTVDKSEVDTVATSETQPDTPNASTSDAATVNTPTRSQDKEDLVKKFKLKPSVEVGIRARLLEKKRREAEAEAARKAAESESSSGTEKINRLFEKLQLGGDDHAKRSTTRITPQSTFSKNVSESWKFLFDDDDLNETKNSSKSDLSGESKETLDKIPGASDLFPALSDYRSSSTTKAPKAILNTTPTGSSPADRWKHPKMKGSERDAFKALFSSLFEQKEPVKSESDPGGKMQSLFSNFNRSGLDSATDSEETSESPSMPVVGANAENVASPSASPSSASAPSSDPMQVLRRQMEDLSKRVEPIYLERKPETPSFQVMKSTVGPHEWMSRDATVPQENSIFNVIREENKVAIRMKKELDEKRGDIIEVRKFVDELLTPFVQSSSDVIKPSSLSLDNLLSRAILAASSTRLDVVAQVGNTEASKAQERPRSLHPYLGQALVEHTRRQGLPVFIRAVRTESYKALLRSRWEAWNDGVGCLEILKEMQRSGALVDSETKSLVRSMRRELKLRSTTPSAFQLAASDTTEQDLRQRGWGDEEQAAPLLEMLDLISKAFEDGDNEYNMKQWAKRASPNMIPTELSRGANM